MHEFDIGFLGKLDKTRSRNQINQDIEALKKSLNSLEIKATLDPKQTQALSKQLNLLQVSLSDASFSPKALNDLVSQVNNALKGIQIPNINIGGNGVNNIGKQMADNTAKMEQFKKSLANIGMGSKEIDGVANTIEKLNVDINSLNQSLATTTGKKGDKRTLSVDIDGVDKFGQAVKLTQQFDANTGNLVKDIQSVSSATEKAVAKIDTFADKQLKLKTSLSDSLNSIKSSVADQNASKPIKDKTNISSLQAQYKVVETAITNVGSASKSTFAQMEAEARTQISVLKDMGKQYRNAENVATSLRTKDFSTVKDVQVQKLQEFKDRIAGSNVSITQMQTDLNNLDTALNGAFDAKTLTDYLNQLDVAQAKFKQLNTQIASSNRNEKVQIKVDGLKSNINEFAQLSTEASNFKTTINGVEVSVKSLTSDLANVKSQGDFSVINEKWKSFSSAAKEAGYSVTNISNDVAKLATEQARLYQANKMAKWLQDNSKATKLCSTKIKEMITTLRSADDLTVPALKNIQTEFLKLQVQAREANKIGFSFGDKLKNGLTKFGDWFGIAAIFTNAVRGAKKVVNNVIEIDTAMTDLRKVCDATDTEFKSFLTTATENAKQLGASISDVVSATADFARLGYNLPDATELARVATLYKNVGDIDISDATTSIISTMKAFNISADESEKIVDVFNEVGNRFAISSAGIGDSLQRSASSLVEANNTLEQATALSVGANDVLQDPEKVGTMWNTVSLRIRGAKTELEDAGLETDGLVESTSKLQAQIKGMTGFDILESDQKTFKSTYDIIVGIGEEYKKLDDVSQASLLELLGGKRQANALASALNNVEDIKNAYQVATDSAGSAAKEQAEYEKSIQYSLDRMGASAQAFSESFLNSGLVKGIVDLGTVGVDGITKLTSALGGLGTVGLGAGLFAGIKNGGIFKQETIKSWFTGINTSVQNEIVQPFQNAEQVMWKYNQAIEHNSLTQSGWGRILAQSDDGLKSYLSSIKGTPASMTGYTTSLQGNITGFKKVSTAIQQYNTLSSSGAKEQTVFSTAVGSTNGKLGNYLTGLNGAKASIGGYVTSLIGATAKTIGLQVATIALNSAITLGTSFIISGIVSAISSWIHHTENLKNHLDDVSDTFTSESSKIDEINSKLEENKKTINNILSLDDITYTDEQELARLREENALLERNLEISKKIKEDSAKDAIDTLEEQFNNEFVTNDAKIDKAYSKFFLDPTRYTDAINAADSSSEYEEFERITNELSAIQKIRKDILDDNNKEINIDDMSMRFKFGDTFDIDDINELDEYISKLSNDLDKSQSSISSWLSKVSEYDPNYESGFAKFLLELQNKILKATDPNNYAELQFDDFVSKVSFEDTRKLIQDKIDNGESLDYSSLLTDDDFDGIINKLSSYIYNATDDKSLKSAASFLAKWIAEQSTKSVIEDGFKHSGFDSMFNSDDFADSKKKLIELAKSGTISNETLESTDEYRTLLKATGLSADEVCEKIKSLVTVTERLSDVSGDLSKLSNAYKEFKDKEKGFVDASTLDGLEEFKNLNSYSDFVSSVGDSLTSVEDKQRAFNKLVSEYLSAEDVLGKLTEQNKNYYVTQLESMGIDNAELIITEKLQGKKEALRLEQQALNASRASLSSSSNGIIKAFLDESNATETTRIELYKLTAEQLIFNNTDVSVENKITNLAKLASEYGATATLVKKAAEDIAYANTLTDEEKFRIGWKGYTENELKKLYDDSYNAIFSSVKYTPSSPVKYTPETESSSKSKNSFSKVFDWIQIKINNVKSVADKAIADVSDGLSVALTNSKVKKAFSSINKEIQTNQKAYSKYMSLANSVGLSNKWKERVKKGDYDISKITNETLSNQIDKYQEYYDAASACKDTVSDLKDEISSLAETLAKAPIDNASKKIDKYNDTISNLSNRIDLTTNTTKKNQYLSAQNANNNAIFNTYNTAVAQEQNAVNKYSKAVRSTSYKNVNDGNSSKYKSAISKAKANIKSKKKISSSTLNTIFAYCQKKKNYSLYESCISFNYSLDGLEDAQTTALAYSYTLSNEKKANWDAIRSNAIDSNNERVNASSGYNYTSSSKNSSLNASNSALNYQNLQYEIETKKAQNNIKYKQSGDAKNAYSSLTKAKSSAKGSYKNALVKAQSYIKARKEIPNSILSIIKKNSNSIYNRCIVYNNGISLYENAKYEQALNYAATSAEKYQNKEEIMNNNLSVQDSQDEIAKAKQSNTKTAKDKNAYTNQQLTNINDRLNIYSKETTIAISEYNANRKKLTSISTGRAAGSGTASWNKYKTYVASATSSAKSKKLISDSVLTALAKGVGEGAVTTTFYQACVAYNDSYNYMKNTEDTYKLYLETSKVDASALTIEKLQNNSNRRHSDNTTNKRTISGISDLLDDDLLFDTENNKTKYYELKLGVLVEGYADAKNDLNDYTSDIKELESEYKKGNITTDDYKSRLEELQESYISATANVKDYYGAIVDLYAQAQQKEIDKLQEVVDARKEAISTKKEYYDYDKTIRNKTKDIQELETQKTALEATEDTIEKRKQLIKLNEQLKNAQDDLDDTKTEHEINLVINGLDDFMDDVNDTFDTQLQNLKSNLEAQTEIINDANKMYADSYSTIQGALKNLLKQYGVDTSQITGFDFSKMAGFANGGIVRSNLSGVLAKNGDSLLASVNPNETLLTNDFTKMLPITVDTMRAFNNIKLPNFSKIANHSGNEITMNYGNLINIEGSANLDTVNELKKNIPQIADAVVKTISRDLRNNGYK